MNAEVSICTWALIPIRKPLAKDLALPFLGPFVRKKQLRDFLAAAIVLAIPRHLGVSASFSLRDSGKGIGSVDFFFFAKSNRERGEFFVILSFYWRYKYFIQNISRLIPNFVAKFKYELNYHDME